MVARVKSALKISLLSLICLMVVGVAFVAAFEKYVPLTSTFISSDPRLSDPSILFASSISSGLCHNSQTNSSGGCVTNLYFYKTGSLTTETIWYDKDGKPTVSTATKELGLESSNNIAAEITSSGILDRSCPSVLPMDVSWNYLINLDGVKKEFDNPPEDCRAEFTKISNLINP